MDLESRTCVPCERGVPKLDSGRIAELSKEVVKWKVRQDRLQRIIKFKNFKRAMRFINRVAEIAESEGHHPDFCVHYNLVEMTLWTHAVEGLSENDFILAAKIDALLPTPAK